MPIIKLNPRSPASWHVARKLDVTASVVAALVGEHEFTTRFELWNLKAGRLDADPEESAAMKRGRLLEPVAVELIREARPAWEIVHNTGVDVLYFRDTDARIGATPDVIAVDPERGPGVVQIKSVESSTFRKKWVQEDGAVEPPLWIALQAMTEAYLTGSAWAAVSPLVVGHGLDLEIIDVPLIPSVVDRLKAESLAFWASIEAGEEPPADYRRDAGAIDRLYRRGGDDDAVDFIGRDDVEHLISERKAKKIAIAQASDDAEAIDAQLKHMMGGAEVAFMSRGRQIRWMTHRRIAPDGKAQSYRVLRVPEPL